MRGRSARGHLLLEAMVAGTLAAIALTSVIAGATRFHGQFGQAAADQQALQYARLLVERWRALPASSSDWSLGVHATPGTVPGTSWTWAVTVTQVSDPLLPGGPVAALVYKKAVATVSYRGRAVSLETLKW